MDLGPPEHDPTGKPQNHQNASRIEGEHDPGLAVDDPHGSRWYASNGANLRLGFEAGSAEPSLALLSSTLLQETETETNTGCLGL